MNTINKICFSIISLLILLYPVVGHAVISKDQRCWTKEGCLSSYGGGNFYGPNEETRKACGTDIDATGKQEVGFCTPIDKAVTQVDFGGNRVFKGIGEFIKWFYKYGVMAMGIFAVVMIINGGMMWAISGGNPEKVKHAQTRIKNALVGLFFVSMSYFILSAINPYLVNLRMPQVWKINTIGIAPPFCYQVPATKKIAFAFGAGEEKSLSEKESLFEKAKKDNAFVPRPEMDAANKLHCGDNFFTEDGSGTVCMGHQCDEEVIKKYGQAVCLPFSAEAVGKEKNKKISRPTCWYAPLMIYYRVGSIKQQYMSSIPGAGAAGCVPGPLLTKLSTPDWLINNCSLVLICRSADGNSMIGNNEGCTKMGVKTESFTITQDETSKGNTKAGSDDLEINEYLRKYYINPDKLKTHFNCKSGYEPYSFAVVTSMDVACTTQDWLLYTGLSSSNPNMAVGGTWSDMSQSFGGFPLALFGEDQKRSVFVEYVVEDGLLETMVAQGTKFSAPVIGGTGETKFDISPYEVYQWWSSFFTDL